MIFWPLALAFFILGLFLPSGALQLSTFVASVLMLNSAFFGTIVRADRRFFAYKWYLFDSLLIPIFLLMNIILYSRQTDELLSSTSLFRSIPWSIFSFSLVPAIAFIFAITVGRSMSIRKGLKFSDYFESADPSFDVVSLLLILPAMGAWVAQVVSIPGISFVVTILNKTFMFFPLIAGYRYRYNRTVWLIWAVVLLFGLGIAALTGNRGLGFYPAWFFVIGFGLSVNRKGLYFTSLILAMILGLYVSGVSSAIRETVGRKSLKDFDIVEVVEAWPEIVRYMTTDTATTAGVKEANPFYKGIKRMVPWTRVVVPNLTGEDGVPYRKTEDLGIDLKAFFFFSKFTRYTGINFYPTVMHASPYGFTVNMSQKKAISTVPFGWEVDGWSRAGWWLTSMYAAIMLAAMAFFERFNQRINRRNPNVRLLCLCVIWGLPFNYFAIYGLIHSLRQYTMQFVAILLIAYGLNWLGKQLKVMFPNLARMSRSIRPRQ